MWSTGTSRRISSRARTAYKPRSSTFVERRVMLPPQNCFNALSPSRRCRARFHVAADRLPLVALPVRSFCACRSAGWLAGNGLAARSRHARMQHDKADIIHMPHATCYVCRARHSNPNNRQNTESYPVREGTVVFLL